MALNPAYQVYSGGRLVKDEVFYQVLARDEPSIFETLRLYEGKTFRLKEHLDRLAASAKTSGYAYPFSRAQLENQIFKAIRESRAGDAVLRLMLVAGQIFVMILPRRPAGDRFQRGLSLKTSVAQRGAFMALPPEIKTSAYQNALLAALDGLTAQAEEHLQLDPFGYVAEVKTGNLFLVIKSSAEFVLLTPPETGILNGVTRRFVIEFADEAGIETIERPFTRHEIFNAPEVFLTNTSWEILPVREVDGRPIGRKVPGEITEKLHRLFQQKVKKECRKK